MKDNHKPAGVQAGEAAKAGISRGRAQRWIALAAFFGMVAFSGAGFAGAWGQGRIHGNDFKHLWAGARILAEGGNPYDPEGMFLAARQYGLGAINPYVYLPATGLMMRPLAALDYAPALKVWFWSNWMLAWGAVLAAPWLLRSRRPALVWLAGGVWILFALPFYRQMSAGQMNVVLMATLLAVPALMIRGRDRTAGIVLGAAAAFKISPLFLILVLAFRGRWRAALWALAALAALCGAAELWAGPGTTRAALPTLAAMRYGASTWAEQGNDFYRDPFNQSINSFFHHIMTQNPHTQPWFDWGADTANNLTKAASALLLALLLCAGWNPALWSAAAEKADHRWSRSDTQIFYLGSLLMLLLPSLMWDHYAVQALPAALFVIGLTPLSPKLWRRTPALAVRALIAPALAAIALVILAWPVAHAAPWNQSGLRLIIMSVRLWGTLLLIPALLLASGRSNKHRL